MKQWFVTFEMSPGGTRVTFNVEAGDQSDAASLGDVHAAAWLHQHAGQDQARSARGAVDVGTCWAPALRHVQRVPPDWLSFYGRRVGEECSGATWVRCGPSVAAAMSLRGSMPPEWLGDVDLPPRLDLRNHSPSGFAWGDLGSASAQLSLAACAFAVGDQRAEQVYQEVKERLFADIAASQWEVSVSHLRELVQQIEADRARRAL